MYCQKCGNEIPDNSVYCDVCGQKVFRLTQEVHSDIGKTTESKSSHSAHSVADTTNKEKFLSLPVILMIVALIFIAVLAVMSFDSNSKLSSEVDDTYDTAVLSNGIKLKEFNDWDILQPIDSEKTFLEFPSQLELSWYGFTNEDLKEIFDAWDGIECVFAKREYDASKNGFIIASTIQDFTSQYFSSDNPPLSLDEFPSIDNFAKDILGAGQSYETHSVGDVLCLRVITPANDDGFGIVSETIIINGDAITFDYIYPSGRIAQSEATNILVNLLQNISY